MAFKDNRDDVLDFIQLLEFYRTTQVAKMALTANILPMTIYLQVFASCCSQGW
jgi:hypothetical protein